MGVNNGTNNTNTSKSNGAKPPPSSSSSSTTPPKEKELITIKDDAMEIVEIKDEDEDEDEEDVMEPLDKEQLEEYSIMLDELGNFADKVQINTLSMVAEDYAQSPKSSTLLYNVIRTHLLNNNTSSSRKLPLVYVIDSILKNVKGKFISLIEKDAKHWLMSVYLELNKDGRVRLKKVWNTWQQFGIFGLESWESMGECFRLEEEGKLVETIRKRSLSGGDGSATGGSGGKKNVVTPGGILKRPDGSLDLTPPLRREMQTLLDEMHTGVDELEKVSLERLADIKPSLLDQIKTIAEQILSSGGGGGGNDTAAGGGGTGGGKAGGGNDATTQSSSSSTSPKSNLPPPYTETRHNEEIKRSTEWNALNVDYNETVHDIIGSLQHSVRLGGSGNDFTMTFDDNEEGGDADRRKKQMVTDLLSSASVTANHLTAMMQHLRTMEEEASSFRKNNMTAQRRRPLGAGPPRTCLSVDKTKFTTEGLKERNDTVIALLYDAGLPFVSSSDGRRFATQIELSNHLDELFRRSQIEKTMERAEERGWYDPEPLWTKLETAKPEATTEDGTSTSQTGAAEEATPESSTVFADESRDRCVVCGINFEMFFDQDEGEYKYRNCKEIKVVDGGSGSDGEEDVLVHVTCMRGLGSPDVLMMHQILHKH